LQRRRHCWEQPEIYEAGASRCMLPLEAPGKAPPAWRQLSHAPESVWSGMGRYGEGNLHDFDVGPSQFRIDIIR
jgi:hypothetical protein